MKVNVQRKLDHVIGSSICLIFTFFSRKKRGILVKHKPKKILIILLSEMGSLVLARPLFDYIKRKYPHSSIYVLLFEQNKEILEIMNVIDCDKIFTVNSFSFISFIRDSIHILMRIRRVNIDTVLDCELFSRISSIYSFLSGAKICVGFHPYTQEGLFRGNFINRPVMYNPYHHISHQFINLAEAIESNGVPKIKRQVTVDNLRIEPMKISQDEVMSLLKRFRRDFLNVTGEKLILIYPGGGLLPIRSWPLEYFCQLCYELLQKGYAVGIIGMKNDKDMANVIISYCNNNNCIDLTGYTKSIRELMIMFHFSSLLIANDGGPGHFAAMTPIPAIIFYGPETPTLYGSLSPNSFNFYVPLSCSPCLNAYNHRNSPCDGNNVCLKAIRPDDVVEKSCDILKMQKNTLFADNSLLK